MVMLARFVVVISSQNMQISNYVVHFLYNFFSHTIPQAIVSGEVRRVGEKSISVEKITITDKQKNQIP